MMKSLQVFTQERACNLTCTMQFGLTAHRPGRFEAAHRKLATKITARPSIFTRMYFTASPVGFGMQPLIITVAAIGKGISSEAIDLEVLMLEIVALQVFLWFAQHRCGTTDRSYGRALPVAAPRISTGRVMPRHSGQRLSGIFPQSPSNPSQLGDSPLRRSARMPTLSSWHNCFKPLY